MLRNNWGTCSQYVIRFRAASREKLREKTYLSKISETWQDTENLPCDSTISDVSGHGEPVLRKSDEKGGNPPSTVVESGNHLHVAVKSTLNGALKMQLTFLIYKDLDCPDRCKSGKHVFAFPLRLHAPSCKIHSLTNSSNTLHRVKFQHALSCKVPIRSIV